MGRKRKIAPGFGERLESLVPADRTIAEFAAALGVSSRTFGNYMRGENEPSLRFLHAIHRLLDVDINWMITGDDPKTQLDRTLSHRLDTNVMDQVGRIVTTAHREASIRLPGDALIRETTALYNEMVDRLEDPSDIDELRSLLPWAKARLKKRLRDAVANPGAGKRSA